MKKYFFLLFVFIILSGGFLSLASEQEYIVLPELAKPYSLGVTGEYFYVAEGASIYIYSMADFSLKRKIGRQGEGPGEFKLPPGGEGLVVVPVKDNLLVNSMGKISLFTKKGGLIKEIKTPTPTIGYYQLMEKGFAGLSIARDNEKQSIFTTVNLYNEKCQKLKEIFRQPFVERGRFEFPSSLPVFYVRDEKIILGGEKGFIINIFNAEGKKVSAIKREYTPLKVTENYKQGVHNYFRTHPVFKQAYEQARELISFPEYFPAIAFFYASAKKIYVITYKEEARGRETFIYDLQGKFIKQVFLPLRSRNALQFNPFTLDDDHFYQLIENEQTEEWSLHIVPIE